MLRKSWCLLLCATGCGARAASAALWRSAIAPAPTSAKQALSSCLEAISWPDDEVADLALLSVPMAYAQQLEELSRCF